jgi:hypothetical protein
MRNIRAKIRKGATPIQAQADWANWSLDAGADGGIVADDCAIFPDTTRKYPHGVNVARERPKRKPIP